MCWGLLWIIFGTDAAGSSNQVDLFGQDLIGDLMDAPAAVPAENHPIDSTSSDVDLFADATFVTAPPKIETGAASQTKVRSFS